jgi:hypothetical protein
MALSAADGAKGSILPISEPSDARLAPREGGGGALLSLYGC